MAQNVIVAGGQIALNGGTVGIAAGNNMIGSVDVANVVSAAIAAGENLIGSVGLGKITPARIPISTIRTLSASGQSFTLVSGVSNVLRNLHVGVVVSNGTAASNGVEIQINSTPTWQWTQQSSAGDNTFNILDWNDCAFPINSITIIASTVASGSQLVISAIGDYE